MGGIQVINGGDSGFKWDGSNCHMGEIHVLYAKDPGITWEGSWYYIGGNQIFNEGIQV